MTPVRLTTRTVRRTLSTLALCAAVSPAALAQTQWIQPTPEELSMTSMPGYPGVSAVVLNKDEVSKDDLHVSNHYARIKILSEDGKKYANVELSFVSTTDAFMNLGAGDDRTLGEIQGRTIHPDGTVIPFTGKPYLKVMEKGKGIKYQAKVFTLPDVTVGSIIEYRYATRINDNMYDPPDWIIQGDLYVKSAHYMWYPTSNDMVDGLTGDQIRSIGWFPLLPKDAKITSREIPGMGANGLSQRVYELSVKDIPPVIDEEFMPPIRNYSYRVYFYYIPETSADEYWKSHGKAWSKHVNAFANPNGELKTLTQQVIAGASTQDQKLRAIYAAVEKLENTDYTRQHDAREDKAAGLGKMKDVVDVYKRGRGDSTQLTELFIGMARAAGMDADAMVVPDRSSALFLPQWLHFGQLEDMIAVVNVDGKDQFFDPGSRYTPYGHLAWQHNFMQGVRQKGNEGVFAQTTGDGYQTNSVARVAILKMDPTGQLTGQIDIAYSGAPAIRWRHVALSGDDESLKHQLRTALEEIIPHTLEVKDVTVTNVADYENPLKITYTVAGTAGTWTGKRLVLPADLFLSNERATFPHEKREIAVDFNYPRQVKDALRVIFPANFSIEAAPNTAKYNMPKIAAYGMTVEQSPSFFTTRREYDFGDAIVLPDQYTQLRTFYSQFEANDQQSVILKSTTGAASASANAGGGN